MADDPLTVAKQRIDLPRLFMDIGVRLREGKTHAGQRYYTGRCPFHDDREPSLSLVEYPDGWGWKCHAGCGQGTVVDFFMVRDRISRAEAVKKALEVAGLDAEAAKVRPRIRLGKRDAQRPPEQPSETGPDPDTEEKLSRLLGRLHTARMRLEELSEPPPLLARYGVSLEAASLAGIGLDEDGGLLIPLYSMWGRLLNIKKRNPEGRKPRYHYLLRGLQAPPWRSPNFQPGTPAVLITEGEMNALAAFEALYVRRERVGTLGMPGAETSLGEWAGELAGKDVFIYADADAPGEKARQRWAEEALRAGAVRVVQMPPLPGVKDYAEMLASVGPERMATYLIENMRELIEEAGEPEEAAASALGIRTLDLTQEPPPVRWVVDEMFQRGKVNLLAAYGGVGKSALAAHLAVTVMGNLPFLERRTFPVKGVLVIDYEDDEGAFLRWARRSARGLGYPEDAVRIHYVSAASDPAWKGRPLSEVIADLEVVLEKQGGEWLIIIDTFESAMQVDTIKAAEVLAAMSSLKRLTNAGHTVVALDHLPKLGRGQSRDDLMPIGSVQKTNQARSVVMLDDVTPEDYPENANLIKVRAVKLNAARRWEPFGVRREVDGDAVRYSLAPLPEPTGGRPADKREALAAAILEELRGGPMTKAELLEVAEELGASERTLKRVLANLMESKAIERAWPRPGVPASYHLIQGGNE